MLSLEFHLPLYLLLLYFFCVVVLFLYCLSRACCFLLHYYVINFLYPLITNFFIFYYLFYLVPIPIAVQSSLYRSISSPTTSTQQTISQSTRYVPSQSNPSKIFASCPHFVGPPLHLKLIIKQCPSIVTYCFSSPALNWNNLRSRLPPGSLSLKLLQWNTCLAWGIYDCSSCTPQN